MHIIVNPEPKPEPECNNNGRSSATVAADAAAALGGNASNATNLTAVQGQNFAIQLPSNSSIGNGNHWALSLYDTSSVTLVNQTFASNISASSTVVGAGGMDVFTFQATQAGTGGIAFSDISPANQTASAVVYSVVIAS